MIRIFEGEPRDSVLNAALNYGYQILLSAFNRECVAAGYLTQIGLWHNNQFNAFNLSCDLMEPFRILVDREVLPNQFCQFGTDEKHKMLNMINRIVLISSNQYYLLDAIRIYCKSVFEALEEGDQSLIRFYSVKEL